MTHQLTDSLTYSKNLYSKDITPWRSYSILLPLDPVTTSPAGTSGATSPAASQSTGAGSTSTSAPGSCQGQKKVVCYFPNWTVWRTGKYTIKRQTVTLTDYLCLYILQYVKLVQLLSVWDATKRITKNHKSDHIRVSFFLTNILE